MYHLCMNSMKNKTLSAATVLCSIYTLLLLSSCGSSEHPKDGAVAETKEKPALAAFVLQKGILNSSLQIPGELVAFQKVDIYAKVNSFVKKMYADVGTEVRQGQLLATMEAPEINSQLAGAQSKLKSLEAIYLSSKATYDRLYQTSQTPGTVSPNDLDIAQAKQKSDLAQYEAAKAAYQEVSDNRNYLEIRAPFDGIISLRNVSAGAYVGPSGKGSDLPLFTLEEQKKLRLVISVPEAYSGYLNAQSVVSFRVRSLNGQVFKAKVSRLAGALDTRLRAQRVEMDVVNNDKKLLPGMIPEVIIPMNSSDSTLIVPKSAVVNSTEKIFVIRVTPDHKAEWVNVQTGRLADGKVEIFGKLNTNDTLILIASEEIRDGAEVKTNIQTTSTPAATTK